MPEIPNVSVVVPMRNEVAHIEDCIAALIAQDYPAEAVEILIVDADSTDGSREIVNGICERVARVRSLRNAKLTAASAMNVGVRAARGDVIVRMDARGRAPAHYVSTIVHYLVTTEAQHVGVAMQPRGASFWGRCIAFALESSFGLGGSRYRSSSAEGWDEAGWLGGFWRDQLIALGGFDEEFALDEDDELAFRMDRLGLRQFRAARVEVIYCCRERLIDLVRQFYGYGLYKVRVIYKHRAARPRHLVAPLAVVSALILLAASIVDRQLLNYFALICCVYLGLGLGFTFAGMRPLHVRSAVCMPIVFLAMHASWGSGFVAGTCSLITELVRTGRTQRVASATK